MGFIYVAMVEWKVLIISHVKKRSSYSRFTKGYKSFYVKKYKMIGLSQKLILMHLFDTKNIFFRSRGEVSRLKRKNVRATCTFAHMFMA